MGYSVEIKSNTFEQEVIHPSYEQPVLIDFFATWCGPCKILKPVLENLMEEYDFILAKVDIDQNVELANRYQIEGVPDVRIASQGEVMPGFVGVLPEDQIRELLSQFNLKSKLEIALETIHHSEEIQHKQDLYHTLLEQYPQHPKLILHAAQFFIQIHQLKTAQTLLRQASELDRQYGPKIAALKQLIALTNATETPEDVNLDPQYAQGCNLTLQQDYAAALPLLLEIVTKNRKYRKDGARKIMLTIFELLGNDAPLTREYRQKLMLSLY